MASSSSASSSALSGGDTSPEVSPKPHVVISTKFEDPWKEISVKVKEGLQKAGCSVYNPNTDNKEKYKEKADNRWLLTFNENLAIVKKTKGFVIQIQQGVRQEKSDMQKAEEMQAGWLNVPRVGIFACKGLQFAEERFTTARRLAEQQWRHGIKDKVEMASAIYEPLGAAELPLTAEGAVAGEVRIILPDGSIYEGQVRENLRNGFGKTTWMDRQSYEGQWQNDRRHGLGKHLWSNGQTYEGPWEKDRMQGKGKATYPSGSSYEGEYANGKRHGKGLYYYKNGDVESGSFREDRDTGLGVQRKAAGGYLQLQDGKPEKRMTEEEAKKLVEEHGLPSLW